MWVKVVTKGIVSGLKELGMQFFFKKKKSGILSNRHSAKDFMKMFHCSCLSKESISISQMKVCGASSGLGSLTQTYLRSPLNKLK